MSISIKPYQGTDYWYLRDNSITSSVSSSPRINNPQVSSNSILDEALPSVVVKLSGKTPQLKESTQSELVNKSGKAAQSDQSTQSSKIVQSEEDETSQSKEANDSKSIDSERRRELYNEELTEQELKLLDELQKADTEVRAHEMAHVAAGGQYITSGAQLEYRKGPDGKRYAVAGEVSIDTSEVAGDPEATVAKMRQVQRAALAPASPSSQDRKVAASAGAQAAEALSELIVSQTKERTEGNENKVFGELETEITPSEDAQASQTQNRFSRRARHAADSYSKVSAMPLEPQVSNFKIAV